MTFNKLALTATLLAASAASNANAGENYFGGGVAFIKYSETGIDDIDMTSAFGKFGTKFNENFAGEVRLGFGLNSDSVNIYGVDVDTELKNYYGAYLKAGINATENVYPYVILGYTRGKIEASAQGYSVSDSESDMSFGLGIDFTVAEQTDLTLEYINYLDKDGVELSGFGLSIARSF